MPPRIGAARALAPGRFLGFTFLAYFLKDFRELRLAILRGRRMVLLLRLRCQGVSPNSYI